VLAVDGAAGGGKPAAAAWPQYAGGALQRRTGGESSAARTYRRPSANSLPEAQAARQHAFGEAARRKLRT
jgi:hypothetical protein